MIKPEGSIQHLKIIESIPKGIIDDLDEYLENIAGEASYVKIKDDPLIMWHFNSY